MQRHYVAGLIIGAYPMPGPEEVSQVDEPQLASVLDAVLLVAERSRTSMVDAGDVADTLLVVHGEPSPYRLIADLMVDWDRVETRVRELLPLYVLLRGFEDAAQEQADAADAIYEAIDRHEAAKDAVNAVHALAASTLGAT